METTLNSNSSNTSANVLMINDKGLMLSVLGQDYFISFNRLPWMKDAAIRDVLMFRCAVTMPSSGQNWILT